jgi:hypothetical protein
MKRCSNCHEQYTGVRCPRCGEGNVSEETDSLDSLVQAASVPNLAALFKRAKETGAIGAVSVYGSANGGA